jgi:putative flippase GtrA
MDYKEILKKICTHQFIRFLMVGVVNTLFGYAVFVALLYFGIHYTIASFISVAVGAYFNFHTTGHFVFGSRNHNLLIKFFSVYFIVYFINIGGLFIFEKLNIGNYLGGAIMIIPIVGFSFYLNKYWVFR